MKIFLIFCLLIIINSDSQDKEFIKCFLASKNLTDNDTKAYTDIALAIGRNDIKSALKIFINHFERIKELYYICKQNNLIHDNNNI